MSDAQDKQAGTVDERERERIRKGAYRWNTAAGVLFSLQSVVMLAVLTRVCDVYTAGVFTIAFAVGNLFMNMGMYGMRKYQVSDRTHEFSFKEYWVSRIATCIAMVACSAAYIAYTAMTLDYPLDKTLVIFVMCIFKAIDAMEDIYSGSYQLQDRLDVGARMVSIRQLFTMAIFVAYLLATTDLLVSLTLTTATTFCFWVGQVRFVRHRYHMPFMAPRFERQQVLALLKQCFPLFAAAFLLFYIGSAPKYAIDAIMDDAAQAYYGYIAMPVFVVTMLASFVYNPLITELTDQWLGGKVRPFLLRFAKIGGVIVAITAVCVALAWMAGVPVLNLLYNTDVGPYLAQLLALVAGGGFLAIATLATVGITIIRFQRVLIPLYLALSILAYLVSQWTVSAWGITGASWAYFGVMGAAALVFSLAFIIGARIQGPKA